MQLELTAVTAKLMPFVARVERHGKAQTPRATLRFYVEVPNEILIGIDPALRSMLYEAEDPAQADLVERPPTKLRIPALAPNFPLKSDWKGVGYTVDIEIGVTGKKNVSLDLCNIDKFSYHPKEGGTVGVSFNVACNPSGADVGTIYSQMGQDVILTVTPPDSASNAAPGNGEAQQNTLWPFQKDTPPTDEEQLQQVEEALAAGNVE